MRAAGLLLPRNKDKIWSLMNCWDSGAGLSSLYPGMQSSTHWVTDHSSPCETIFQHEDEEEEVVEEEEEVVEEVEEEGEVEEDAVLQNNDI